MKYRSSSSFRQALEVRLRDISIKSHQPLIRLRKMVALERFLARLIEAYQHDWVLKGGLAIQLYLGRHSRTTKDIDLEFYSEKDAEKIHEYLINSLKKDLEDDFEFEIQSPSQYPADSPVINYRFHVISWLDGRSFETFHVDVGVGDPVPDHFISMTFPPFLQFADIQPLTVPCYPLENQVAEKLHAYTRTYRSGSSTRLRDLIDILLLASNHKFTAVDLKKALKETFTSRKTHPLPSSLPKLTLRPATIYKKLAHDLSLPWPNIEQAWQAAVAFLEPILQNKNVDTWDPISWQWKVAEPTL